MGRVMLVGSGLALGVLAALVAGAAAAPAPPKAKGGDAEVQITFRTDPSGADVREEGGPVLCTTPCQRTIEREAKSPRVRTFELSRTGCISTSVEVDLAEGDQVVHVTLVGCKSDG